MLDQNVAVVFSPLTAAVCSIIESLMCLIPPAFCSYYTVTTEKQWNELAKPHLCRNKWKKSSKPTEILFF